MTASGGPWRIAPRGQPDEIADYESLLDREDGELLATARTRFTRRILVGEEAYYLKVQRYPDRRPKAFLRASAFLREVRAYDRMRRIGIRTPFVVGAGERRRGGFLVDALLVTREVAGSVDVERWAALGFAGREGLPPWPDYRRELLQTVRRAHALGYRFGDLKWRNLLAAPADATGSHVVVLDQRRFHRCPWRRFGVHGAARDLNLLAQEEARCTGDAATSGRTPAP